MQARRQASHQPPAAAASPITPRRAGPGPWPGRRDGLTAGVKAWGEGREGE